jgi:hypothetical protein
VLQERVIAHREIDELLFEHREKKLSDEELLARILKLAGVITAGAILIKALFGDDE